ncbi:type I DNA topoisomerase [Bifidobacterium pseudocatenulatum]|uniref:DNA topoisomerase 1 n=1 Tax=Bifidobacterium pseudocatenulatum DSM 20438 = JCM 1200 = LMG 10505 TaxID=547043 RepID=C0BR25_BIFPS|nr:type I DNA topoisomerase [Bifidobacterium pseudocatenulatum]EEG71938.1 DNA topoisomerase I [Bifidobacterium pseudocatenulatum DSM 20438 = JCM 1200 = LMG 10505]KFI75117.1 DNA topoisomerase I [Bifidobacterium pseudocatenulatum DSM 20438 = JCM 1200 = LMG 10505]MCG4621131.1 type I DNA topoisomerase [Bifidobacterium pseudocatenulatum]MCG4628067.1 type I DNA topoisomerase [Bifidobacterium pseudocatenulatum]MCQ4963567.1 type I DNA topoisomerase [Bifidobacterium pseudocatenulatum]
MATGSKLVIVESPTKAKKIGGYLGSEYTVMASVGHIRDLAQPSQVPAADKTKFGKFGVDVEDGFKPYYIVDGNKKKTVSELKSALKKADTLYLATDEDREGEAIAWHLVQTLKPKVPVKRMVFHEITKEAIKASLDNTRDVDDDMVDAQETRRILDRLYGYELSPVLWRKVGPGLSAGRVQSVATRLIVERERERMAFVRAPYWDVTATLEAPDADGNNVAFDSRMVSLGGRRLAGSKDFGADGKLTAAGAKDQVVQLDEAQASAIAQALEFATFTVASMETKPYRRRPVPPFTTSTLQQTAGNRLGMSSRQTMRAAQGLYENGYITYMRTDSVTLSQEAIAAAREAVVKHFGENYLSDAPKQYATKTAGAQEAHECIRPAGAKFRDPAEIASKVPADQLKLYTLIWQRTLACQMADATGSTATVRLSASTESNGEAMFQASGTVIEFPGFMKATGEGRRAFAESKKGDVAGSVEQAAQSGKSSKADKKSDDNVSLPPMNPGDALAAVAVGADGHETQPPARYTEASLVKTLEQKEIGRPSTYASIISTIIDRGYVYERGRALIPSWLAFSVVKLLETKFPRYVDYEFTADMESGLDQIASGQETGRNWLTRFYFGSGEGAAQSADEAHAGLQQQVAQLGEIDAREINTIEIGDGLHVRVGRYGPYLEDMNHLDDEGNPKRASLPDTLAPDELTVEVGHDLIENHSGGPRALGVDPVSGGTVEVRNGRFGPYVALVMPSSDAGADGDVAGGGKSKKGKSAKKAADRPKMASLFKTMSPESLTLDDALRLLSLPREIGSYEEVDAQTGEVQTVTVQANNGRYGPYLTKTGADGKSDTRSLASEDEIFTVDLDKAKELFAQPKYGRGRGRGAAKPPLRELGVDPETQKQVTIKEGFYGAYITDGETNRTLPKQYAPESIEPAEAFRLLAEKRAQGPSKRRGRKGAAGKGGAKKTAAKGAKASADQVRADRRAKVRELADKGWANTRIAKEIGSTPTTVKADVEWLAVNEGYTRPAVVPAR